MRDDTLRRRIVTALVGIAGVLFGMAVKSTGQTGALLFLATVAVLVLASVFVI